MMQLLEYLAGANITDCLNFLWHVWTKGALILGAGALLVLGLRRISAAARHWVWTLALSGALFVPLLATVLPIWRVHWVPEPTLVPYPTQNALLPSDPAQVLGSANPSLDDVNAVYPTLVRSDQASLPTSGRLTQTPFSALNLSLWTWLLLVWFVGALLVLIPFAAGRFKLSRILRRAVPVNDDAWAVPLVETCDLLGVRPNVRMLRSCDVAVPMVWGWRKPLLVVPADSDTWSDHRRRMVLLHELAHVQRRDCLTQFLARVACAAYWFNPLVWLGAWRMRVERERACDDVVLSAGAKASEYADELLQLTSALPSNNQANCAAIAMSRRSTLEGRLLAILDATRQRYRLGNSTMIGSLLLLTCLLVPIVMLRGAEKSTASASQTRHFVRLVVGQTNMTFQGEPVTWEKLPAMLADIPDRKHTVLELATENDTMTLAQFNPIQTRVAAFREKYGFEYLSLVGVHPLGSKGDPDLTLEDANVTPLNQQNPQWQDKLNPDQKAILDWTDRQFRSFFDNREFVGYSQEERDNLEKRLIDSLKGPVNREYYENINTLVALRSRKAVAPLLAIASEQREKNNRDRWMAIRALGIIGDKSVVPELIHLVYYPNMNTRWWAQISLVRLTGKNFGKDWEAWGRWWNDQKSNPPFVSEKITWSSNPEYTDPQKMEKADQDFLEKLKQPR